MTKIWNFLGSRDLSVFIFVMGLTYILFLVIFGAIIPVWWVNNIASLLPFKVLFTAFFINLIVCEIKWIPVVVRRCKRPEAPTTEEDLQRFRHKITVSREPSDVSRLERYLRRRGYKVKSGVNPPQSLLNLRGEAKWGLLLYAYKGRFSPVGNLLFHISFLFLAAGVFASMFYRFETKVLLMEGQEFGGVMAGAPDINFEVMDIKPRFWKEKLLFTDLTARIRHGGGEEIARLSSAVRLNGTRVTIAGVSYTPRYVLREIGGRELDMGYVNLANFVPGSTDHFQIPIYPYKIYLSIYPDFDIKDGRLGTKSMNLLNPRYAVRIVRNKVPVYSGLLGLNEEAYFDGLALSFPEIRYNGTFHIVKDPGFLLIWIAFILMAAGLIWKLLFYRREVVVSATAEGIDLIVNCDYYPYIYMSRFASALGRPID